MKYTGDGKQKRINLRVKDVGDFIQVEIEDNGERNSGKDLLIYLTDFTEQMLPEIPLRRKRHWSFYC